LFAARDTLRLQIPLGAAVKLMRRRLVCLAAGAAALLVVSEIARAQVYPPVTIIVPVPPGGVADRSRGSLPII